MSFVAGQRLTAAALNTSLASVPQLVGSTILTSSQASIIISVPTGFNHLTAIWSARSDTAAAATNVNLRFNGDTGNNYLWEVTQANNATVTAANSGGAVNLIEIGAAPAATATANYFGNGNFSVANVSSAVFKPASGTSNAVITTSNMYGGTYGGLWLSTAVITSVTLVPTAGNLIAGSSLSLYGWQ